MTHCGPHLSSTSQNWDFKKDSNGKHTEEFEERPTHLGSKTLSKVVKKYNNDVMLNIHGHSHEGVGMNLLWNVRVINPGSSAHGGNFAKLVIVRDKVDKRWKFKKCEFININGLD